MGNDRRFAYEEYVRNSDRMYWDRTKGLVASVEKKMTALIAASTAISVVALMSVIFSRIHRCR